jgi:hypothetical protein
LPTRKEGTQINLKNIAVKIEHGFLGWTDPGEKIRSSEKSVFFPGFQPQEYVLEF